MSWEQVDESKVGPAQGDGPKAPKKTMKVAVPKWCGQWAVGMDQYKDGVVGAKSKNIAGEARALPVIHGACCVREPGMAHHQEHHLAACMLHQAACSPDACRLTSTIAQEVLSVLWLLMHARCCRPARQAAR